MLDATHPVAHLLCDGIAMALEGLSGTSWLCRVVGAFPAIISVLLPLALQLFFFFFFGHSQVLPSYFSVLVGSVGKIVWSGCSEMLHTPDGAP